MAVDIKARFHLVLHVRIMLSNESQKQVAQFAGGVLQDTRSLEILFTFGAFLGLDEALSTKGGKVTIEKLEAAGITSAREILEMSDIKIVELVIDSKKMNAIRSCLKRK